MIKEKLEKIKSGKLTAEKNIKFFLERIKKQDKNINAFLETNDKAIEQAKKVDKKIKQGKAGKLSGLAIAVKANINCKGLYASCASKTLEDYKAAFDASVIEKIKKEDGIIIGITNMDEFASGSSGETSAFQPVKNPTNPELIPGGSSSGSAAAIAADLCDLSLGSDTAGSVRNPASHCGVYGLKPTYGIVSRYGLIDLSMSLDQIGCFAKDIEGIQLLFDVIKGKDEKDTTTKEYKKQPNKNTIGIIKGIEKLIVDKKILESYKKEIKKLKNKIKIKEISIKHIDLAVQTYYLLMYVEFFSSTRRFHGRLYGKKIENHAGEEVLRRILAGGEIAKAEFYGKYYRKALLVKQIIRKEFEKAFKQVDCIVLPTVPKLPHKIGSSISIEEMYAYDALTVPANLAEICAISIPGEKINNIPIGLQLFAAKGQEEKLFKLTKLI